MIIPIIAESDWRASLECLPTWRPPLVPTLVIAPHPDDETLGAGGLIAWLRKRDVPVTVVAVTDGELAYGVTPGMAQVREREQTKALALLGVPSRNIVRLRLPDTKLSTDEERMLEALLPLASSHGHIVAPWQGDFHPDHEACGRVAAQVAEQQNLQLTSYLFWTWHRGTPHLLKELATVMLALSHDEIQQKQEALQCHQSQLEHVSGEPILPEYLLAPMKRPFEVYLPA